MMRAFARLLAALVVAVAAAAPSLAAPPEPTLQLPLPGSGPVWADLYFHAGWRIQKNVLTDEHRLLDEVGAVRLEGTYQDCRYAFERFRRALALAPRSSHLVVLLPGLGDHPAMFSGLAERLRPAGFETLALSYPSTRYRLAVHAGQLATLLNRLEGYERVSFVSYSLGGLVVRALFDREADPWRRHLALGRLAMVAPPNQGSAAAVASARYGSLERAVPVIEDLQPENARSLPVPPMPFMILAGGLGNDVGFNPLLPGDDDGLVSLEETRLDGAAGYLRVPRLHAFVDNHPKSVAAILHFLKGGAPPKETTQ